MLAARRMRKMSLSLVFIALSVYAGLSLSLYFFQARLVYLPSGESWNNPETVGLAYEDVYLDSADQATLHAWYVPAAGADVTVLFCHGNGGNISHRLETLKLLHELRVNVLIFDYAGYGKSTGSPSEAQTYQDALAAWAYLTEQRQQDADGIVVFGRSLGAGIASWLAIEVEPAGLVIESAFTSVPDMAAKLYPILPVRWLAKIKYDNRSRISNLSVPLLVMHSPDDKTIPYEHGQTLHDIAPGPKYFLEMNGGHNNGFIETGQRYRQALSDFFASLQSDS